MTTTEVLQGDTNGVHGTIPNVSNNWCCWCNPQLYLKDPRRPACAECSTFSRMPLDIMPSISAGESDLDGMLRSIRLVVTWLVIVVACIIFIVCTAGPRMMRTMQDAQKPVPLDNVRAWAELWGANKADPLVTNPPPNVAEAPDPRCIHPDHVTTINVIDTLPPILPAKVGSELHVPSSVEKNMDIEHIALDKGGVDDGGCALKFPDLAGTKDPVLLGFKGYDAAEMRPVQVDPAPPFHAGVHLLDAFLGFPPSAALREKLNRRAAPSVHNTTGLGISGNIGWEIEALSRELMMSMVDSAKPGPNLSTIYNRYLIVNQRGHEIFEIYARLLMAVFAYTLIGLYQVAVFICISGIFVVFCICQMFTTVYTIWIAGF